MEYQLLTGATGLLGRYLVRDLTMEGVPLAVLVRRSRRQTPQERIESAICTWEEKLGTTLARPRVLEGDISQPGFGLSQQDRDWVKENCGSIIHNAASLQFISTSKESEPWRSNVQGTKYAIDFCHETGIDQFHHVSTSYTCGLRHGRILESELDVGQELGNDYERSKVQAEKMVREAGFSKPPTVFRPAIIVGDSRTGWSTTFHNFYVILQIAETLTRQKAEPDVTGRTNVSDVQLNVDGTERKNFVPVDWVSAVMSHILTHPDLHGETYHLTPRCPITTRQIRDAVEAATQIYGLKFYGAGEVKEVKSEYEELFREHMRVYDSYWRDDPIFDSTNTRLAAPHLPCPHIDLAMLNHLSRAAIDMKFRWNDPVIKKQADHVCV
ncbi:MAG: SDR family oxidoreductase [Planctomycetaceae bacterium]|nr:SDR family oxidoreductase [Planctomycetaceae bacterium]